MFLNPSLTFYFKMFNSPKTGIGALIYLPLDMLSKYESKAGINPNILLNSMRCIY